jgi:hypothetical protein
VTAVFRLLDVDYRQWKAITRTLLRSDFRVPLADGSSPFGRAGRLLTLALMLGLFGVGAAALVFNNGDVLLTGTIALAYVSVMLATMLLTQHGATLLSTADYVVLGARPVASRTFFAIRMTNVLFHALLLTTLMAYPIVLAYALTHDAHLRLAAGAIVAVYGWTVAVTLLLVASYGSLLTIVGTARLHRTVGYLQLLAGLLSYGGLLLTSRVLGRSPLAQASMPDRWWLVLMPPSWFASYLELASGDPNSTTLLRAAIAVGTIIALAFVLRGRLGLDYARRLAEVPAMATPRASSAAKTPFFRRGEARAVAILVLAHFRHDLRVRMGILAVLPMMALYVLIDTRDRSFDLIAMAVLLFPALLSQHFAATDAYAASWIYHATPSSPARMVIALKNISVVYFLLPFLVFVAGVFTWRIGNAWEAVVHTTILGLLSHISLQGSAIIRPRLPFALPPDKTRGSGTLLVWMLFVMIGGQLALFALDRWVYVSAGRTAGVVLLLMLLTLTLDRVALWHSPPARQAY